MFLDSCNWLCCKTQIQNNENCIKEVFIKLDTILYQSCYHFNQHYWNPKQLDKKLKKIVSIQTSEYFSNPDSVTIWLLNLPIFKYQIIVYWCFGAFKQSHLSISIHTENSNAFTHHDSTQGWRFTCNYYCFNYTRFWSCYTIL